MTHVMVVEDEPVTAADLEQKLTVLGHDVTWFDTAEEAIACANTLAPDLVLMDIRLRGELDGIEAARQLHERQEVPIVFITAFCDQATVDRACEVEPYGYLLKPFTQRSVATAVQVALKRIQVERSKLEREQWSERALQQAGDGVIVVDDVATIRLLNARAESLLGVRGQDVRGADVATVLRFADEAGAVAQPIHTALHDRRPTSSAARTLLCEPSGSKLRVAYSAAPVSPMQDGKPGAMLVFREVASGDALASTEPLVALDELSRRLAHEINNPLTYNLGALGLALRELDELRALSSGGDSVQQLSRQEREQQLTRIVDYLQNAREGATRVAGVVRELSLFALTERDHHAALQPVDLVGLAIELSKLGTLRHIQWVRRVSAAPIVRGNKWQLAGVLAYALRSAVEALESRGAQRITLVTTVGSDRRGWAELRVTAEDAQISDSARTGTASAAEAAKLTTVSRKLAEQVAGSHGGALVVTDLPSVPSIVLYLPPMDAAALEAAGAVQNTTRAKD